VVKYTKDVFWKAAVITVVIFLIGVYAGFAIEGSRLDRVGQWYNELDFQLTNAKLQTQFYQILDEEFCDEAIIKNLEFSDEIYYQGRKIDEYESSNKLKEFIDSEKRRYALLKTEFLVNSLILKEKCDADYDILIYFYKDDPSLLEQQQQSVQANILLELKEKYGTDLMLIPLPIDFDVSVISILVDYHNIQSTPALVINQRIKLEGLQGIDEIESLL